MDIEDFDRDQVARGLCEAVGFYARKVDELNRRRGELAQQLASIEHDVAQAEARRESLALALAELTGPDIPPSANLSQPSSADETAEDLPGETPRVDGDGQLAAADPALGHLRQKRGGGLASGQLAEAVMQVMVTSGREMRVRQITEALGRPPERRKFETVRVTVKRLVEQGRLSEVETGLYRIAPVLRGVA